MTGQCRRRDLSTVCAAERCARCANTTFAHVIQSAARQYSDMDWLFQPLLTLLAGSSKSEMAQQIEFLKVENQLLRRRLQHHLVLSEQEKRLIVKLGLAVGPGIRWLLSV